MGRVTKDETFDLPPPRRVYHYIHYGTAVSVYQYFHEKHLPLQKHIIAADSHAAQNENPT
jgi:hypothetical protein